MKLYYHHVGILGSSEDFKKTVFGHKPLEIVKDNVPNAYPHKAEMLKVLRANFSSNNFNCWGVPAGASSVIRNLNVGDAVLLVESTGKDGRVPVLGVVVGFWQDELKGLSKALWGLHKFPYIFFFNTERLSLKWEQMRKHVGYKPKYNPRGKFLSVADVKLDSFGGVERYIEFLRAHYAESGSVLDTITVGEVQDEIGKVGTNYIKKIEKEISKIKQSSLDKTPKLTEGKPKRVKERTERPRSAAFRVSVKKLYKSKCAICGFSLKSPDGTPAVDSAHIYPKEFDGSDDFRNGICLCRMHHWAFDAGWLSIADDFTVIVRDDLPESEEYDFIRNYEGQELTLPEQAEFAPHTTFLHAHRKLKGFKV
jgi:hypothetical protein